LNIATFLAGVLEKEDNVFRRLPLAYGSGAHLDRNVALVRALTEAAQTRLTNVVGARDDTLPGFLVHARSEERQKAYRAEVMSVPNPMRVFGRTPHALFDSFEQDLECALRQLHACGMDEVLRVDLSRAEWPVHVVRLIIPGLEAHIDMPEYRPSARGARVSAES
jgi:ribosomal protein S12 methylthiotransferase accessory factor